MFNDIEGMVIAVTVLGGEMVPLTVLQKHLNWHRDRFDRIMQLARKEGKLTATCYEGREGITKEEREAGYTDRDGTIGYLSIRI